MTPELLDPSQETLAALAALYAACFAEPWTEQAIAGLLATPNCFAFSIVSGSADAPEGFVLARAAGGEGEILTLAVSTAARGQGLGRALMRAAARHAQMLGADALFLEVGAGNHAALALYRRLGFARVAERKGYYRGGDALVMKTALPLSSERNIA